MLAWYSRFLSKRPLVGSALTSSIVCTIGDGLTQVIAGNHKSHSLPVGARGGPIIEKERSISMAVWGTGSGMIAQKWFQNLDNMFPLSHQSQLPRSVFIRKLFVKTIFHQLTFAPAMNGLYFGYVLWYRAILEGKDIGGVPQMWMDRIRNDLIPTTIRSCTFWLPGNLIMFTFIPLQYRVLWQSSVLTMWMAYLSFFAHSNIKTSTLEDGKVSEPS